jgi:hypothetical protein
MIGRPKILASGEVIAAATTYPENRLALGSEFSEVTWIVDVQAATGAGNLVASMSGVLPHTTGQQYLNERLFALDAVQLANLTAEGEDWPNPLATNASAFPLTVQRTYIGFGNDLRLTLTPTGGATFTVTVVVHGKG